MPPEGDECYTRIAAWSFAILITVIARLIAYESVGKLKLILGWMSVYLFVWELTVVTAYWDAHESFNPFHKWIKAKR